ncbi:sterol carrier family protein [Streptomyces sp. NPDC091292]|uniref:maleylpyruvate isomerase family mycothiol-dependent enzyme n=1 Tax=Streptomyces sp. NPDC091292 TaxID=3365991 RepID=UPI0037F5EC14
MPPVKKRPRSYDPRKIRAAVFGQFGAVRDGVRGVGDEVLGARSGVGEWSVRDLVAHVAMALGGVERALDAVGAGDRGRPEVGLLDWPFATGRYADGIDEDTRALGARHPDLDALFGEVGGRVAARLDEGPGTRLVRPRMGTMTLDDYLVTRTVELVVHTDDLNRATGLAIPFDRQALAAAVRLLADALAVKAPGGSTEVRIPPYAVVQCVEGPRHTRGTPPNVVETDPLTWIRLATGRTDWATEREAATVSASGERADLSALLPILR